MKSAEEIATKFLALNRESKVAAIIWNALCQSDFTKETGLRHVCVRESHTQKHHPRSVLEIAPLEEAGISTQRYCIATTIRSG